MPLRSRNSFAFLLTAGLGLTTAGCGAALFSKDLFSSMDFKPAIMDGFATEQRVITHFTDARSEDNEAAFRQVVSTRFEQKALRSKDAYKDLEILSLPKSALEVVESKEADDKTLEVVAKDEGGTKYQFRILRDPEKRRWVVDDVLMRQQKKGTRASKSAVEVMDLLLTVRDFLDNWQRADRATILAAVSPELRAPLDSLPEPWLQRLIDRVSAEYETGMARRPEAQLNASDAVVRMPSKNGFLLMKVVRDDDGWLVSDIEIRQRKTDEHPGSLLRQARALNTVTSFLSAYSAGDTERLRELSEKRFHDSALSIGDLSMIRLPNADNAPEDFELRSFAGQLTVIIPDQTEIVRLALESSSPASVRKPDSQDADVQPVEAQFVVADVTIYDRATQRQRNLRSAFTAPARAQLFLSALDSRELPMVRQISSMAMSELVWSRLSPDLIASLSLENVPAGSMTLQDSIVRGDTTELEFLSSDGRICSVVMKDENGTLKVDDVQFSDADARISSLRTQLMLSVPAIELARAWQRHDLQLVQQNCSMDFNRLVWSNVQELPSGFDRLPELLLQPVLRAEASEHQAQLQLAAAGRAPVTIRLTKENSAWVVDEISLTQADGTAFDMRRSLRQEIAQRFLDNPSGGITKAMYSTSGDQKLSEVTQAVHQSDSTQRGNLTLPSNVNPTPRRTVLATGLDLTEATPVAPAAEKDVSGTLRFGPDAATLAAEAKDARRPDVLLETEEHDGVMYFQGDPDSSPSADSAVTPPAQIQDLSQHPIEIPID